MNDPFEQQVYRLQRQEIGYLRFLVEGYDGLLFLRTVDAADGLVAIAWPASRGAEAAQVLAALDAEIGLKPCNPEPPVGADAF